MLKKPDFSLIFTYFYKYIPLSEQKAGQAAGPKFHGDRSLFSPKLPPTIRSLPPGVNSGAGRFKDSLQRNLDLIEYSKRRGEAVPNVRKKARIRSGEASVRDHGGQVEGDELDDRMNTGR